MLGYSVDRFKMESVCFSSQIGLSVIFSLIVYEVLCILVPGSDLCYFFMNCHSSECQLFGFGIYWMDLKVSFLSFFSFLCFFGTFGEISSTLSFNSSIDCYFGYHILNLLGLLF